LGKKKRLGLDHPSISSTRRVAASRNERQLNFREPTMTINQNEAERMGRAVAGAIHEHWGLFLAEGIILVILGLIAIVVPPIATIAFTIIIGWIFLVSGVLGLITTFWARGAPGFWWSLISAIIAIAAGVVLLLWPISGSLSLTLLLIAFFVVEGIVSIMYAIEHRNQLSGRWVWMLVSGIVDLILAGIIFAGLPGTAVWALGLLVGINMVFGGAALIAMALAARQPA
jgi:uncharacterized membrane protein HdeD (DUF308 family)